MLKQIIVPALVLGFASASAFAGDINQDARDIARDAADIAHDRSDIQADRAVLRADLSTASALRVDRRIAEEALAKAVQAGDIAAAQSDLAKVAALTSAIRQEETKVAQVHRELTADRLDRALDKAELTRDVRDMTGDATIHAEENEPGISNAQLAADRVALDKAFAALEGSVKARQEALAGMAAAVKAGDIATAQADLSAAEALKAAIQAQAKAVAAAHAELAKDKAAAKAAAKAAKSGTGSKGKK
ncbi:hypothetical protein [Aquitalea sp. LB_tupeE]|uniref:hypothetical protein n=1 Tax=Aquitalea sp. LB_tupeE TaxID=2748078 RepID=UPI0015B97B07|nr:hypothetical protein [Aquitalea sp. LB_tupeE]NWK77661.1 hypothetical protein [Aquitalea sp. LB_tupeE]